MTDQNKDIEGLQVSDQIDDHCGRIKTIEEWKSSHSIQQANLLMRLAELKVDFHKLNNRVAKLEERIEGLQARFEFRYCSYCGDLLPVL